MNDRNAFNEYRKQIDRKRETGIDISIAIIIAFSIACKIINHINH